MELSDRKLQPKDVPGTLLNIALFNLCGSDVVQRAAAYQLLCAVKESFQLLSDTKLLSTAQGVHVYCSCIVQKFLSCFLITVYTTN